MSEQKRENAPREALSFPDANVRAIENIASILEPTYGPGGMYKLVHRYEEHEATMGKEVPDEETLLVTGDGRALLEELPLAHPVTAVVRRIGGPDRPGATEVEGELFPDGVSASLVLASRLLTEGLELLDRGLHPTTVQKGYHEAYTDCFDTLDRLVRTELDKHVLRAVAATAITNTDFGGNRDTWARYAVDIADTIGYPSPTTLAVRTTRRGSPSDPELINGAILHRHEVASREMPLTVEEAKILVLAGTDDGGLRTKETKRDYNRQYTDSGDIGQYEEQQQLRREELLSRLVESDVSVVVAEQGIDTQFQHLLAEHDIMGIRGVTGLSLDQVANATGAEHVKHTFEFSETDLGYAGTVHEEVLKRREHRDADRRMIVFEDCQRADAVSVLLTGVLPVAADPAKRQLRKAVAAVAQAQGAGPGQRGYLPGGGGTEMTLAKELRDRASSINGRKQLAYRAFADALESIVTELVRNCGQDPASVITRFRASNAEDSWTGFHFPSNDFVDTRDLGLFDPYALKRRCLVFGFEVARVVLRIDDAVDASFSETPAGPGDSINEKAAERHMDYIEENDTRWSEP